MNNIDRIVKYWGDLDQSYEIYKDELKVDNKLDYLKKLTGYDEETKTTKLVYLKGKIQEEMADYDDKFSTLAEALLNIFNGVDLIINKLNKNDVVSLMNIVRECLQKNKEVKTVDRVLDSDFFSDLLVVANPDSKYNAIPLSISDALSNLNLIGESFVLSEGSVKHYDISTLEGHAYVLTSFNNINYLNDEIKDKEFIAKLIEVFISLNNNGKLAVNTLFIDKTYFSVIDKILRLKFGNMCADIKIQKNNTWEYSSGAYYTCSIKLPYDTLKIVAID